MGVQVGMLQRCKAVEGGVSGVGVLDGEGRGGLRLTGGLIVGLKSEGEVVVVVVVLVGREAWAWVRWTMERSMKRKMVQDGVTGEGDMLRRISKKDDPEGEGTFDEKVGR